MKQKMLFLFVVIVIICTSCNQQYSTTESANIADDIPITYSESMHNNQAPNGDLEIQKIELYGTWSLDKVILSSKNYVGEKNWGDGHIFSEKQYVGYEVEYTPDYFRLGDQKFFSPMYKVSEFRFYDFNNNGDFENPDLYEFVKKEGVHIDKIEEYENMDDIPLTYFLVTLNENNFIPVGDQCLLLNENIMLVGVWGDVILAHRLE